MKFLQELPLVTPFFPLECIPLVKGRSLQLYRRIREKNATHFRIRTGWPLKIELAPKY